MISVSSVSASSEFMAASAASNLRKFRIDFTNLPTANYIVTTDADFAIGEVLRYATYKREKGAF